MDPVVARKTWRTVEPIHAMIYFVPEADECYSAIGIHGNRMGYFASRSAAFGAAPAEVVISTFFNFNPDLVRSVIPAAWSLATPEDVLAARFDAADRALRRGLGDEVLHSDEVQEAANLARKAAIVAASRLEGRPLFAAHTTVPWPRPPHLVLWHAQTLLREFRGDAHIAALVLAGLDPVEALVTHAAAGETMSEVLIATRAWSRADWDAGVLRLVDKGILRPGEGLTFTEAGSKLRQEIEDQTDAASVLPYAALGEAACARLRELARPLSQAIVTGGLLNVDPSRLRG